MKKVLEKGNHVLNIVIGIILFCVVMGVLLVNATPTVYNIKAGDISKDDIYAPWDMSDIEGTAKLKEDIKLSVQPVYKLDLTVQEKINEQIKLLFEALHSVATDDSYSLDEKIKFVKELSGIDLAYDDYKLLIETTEEVREQLKTSINLLINDILTKTLTTEQLLTKNDEITLHFKNAKGDINRIGGEICNKILKPNMFFDQEGTNDKILTEQEKIKDIVIKKGIILASKGEEVTPQQIDKLEKYGLVNKEASLNYKIILALLIIIILLCCVFAYYISSKYSEITIDSKYLTVILIMQIISFIFAVAVKDMSMFLIPIAANCIIVTLLVGPGTAMLVGALNTILVSYLVEFNIVFIITSLLSTFFCIAYIPKKYSRRILVATGIGVGIINAAVIISFAFYYNTDIKLTGINILYGFINGAVSTIIAIGIMPFFETIFDIITPVRLMEYSNPNQPLLKRLLMEAPGTYYHSVLVGNLAESAAEEIGADAILCRIGANYHDIGKLKRPYYFKENQTTSDNPHDKLKPEMSAKIITSHVDYGIELATKGKLPQDVIDIIAQHHGDTLVAYFYYNAKKEALEGQVIDQNKYRYMQSKPKSKEAAIVMLADSAEAYVRSLTQPTPEQLVEGLRKIIFGKIQDGQLNICELNFIEIEKIINVFVNVLGGIFHDRIEYPEDIKEV